MTVDELALKWQETTDRSVRNEGRIKKLETEQATLHSLATSVATLTTNQAHIETDVKEIKADVKSVLEKPGKRWEAIVAVVLTTIVAAVVGFALARMGM